MPNAFQGLLRAGGAAEAMHEVPCQFLIGGGAEDENDLAFLTVLQRRLNLDGGARIETGAQAAGQPHAAHGGRIGGTAVAAEEFGAVGGHGAGCLAAVDEGDAIGELGAVGVVGEDGAADGVQLGHHLHERLVAHIAQHPFPPAGDRELPCPAGAVGDLEAGELDRRIGGDVEAELGDDAVLGVLEKGVPEAVAGDVGILPAGRQRRGGPEAAVFLVADVDRLAAGVHDRVVVPGGEAKLVAVFRPGIDAAAFGNDRAEM